jgi:predicted metal-dependent hydrolase
MNLDWSCGELAEGLRCYRNQEFFLAHEHWESVWLGCDEPVKTFLQALIQITAAFHHLQRNNSVGAASLLSAASRRLDPYPATFEGIDVATLRKEVQTWMQALAQQEQPLTLAFPRMRESGGQPVRGDGGELPD